MKLQFPPNPTIMRAIAQSLNEMADQIDAVEEPVYIPDQPVPVGVAEQLAAKEEPQLPPVTTEPEPNLPPVTQIPSAAVELDCNQRPWDARINAKTKTFNADGSWKILRRPKVYPDDESWKRYVTDVQTSLDGKQVVPPPVVKSENPAPNLTVVPPVTATFADVCQLVTNNAIPNDVVQQACEQVGIGGFHELMNHQDKIAPLMQVLTNG